MFYIMEKSRNLKLKKRRQFSESQKHPGCQVGFGYRCADACTIADFFGKRAPSHHKASRIESGKDLKSTTKSSQRIT